MPLSSTACTFPAAVGAAGQGRGEEKEGQGRGEEKEGQGEGRSAGLPREEGDPEE